MNKIILVGDKQQQVEKIICNILSDILLIKNNSIIQYGDKINTLLMCYDNINNIDIRNSIIIFCNNHANVSNIKENNIAITLSTNTNVIKFLIKNNIPTIKVGMFNNDTITFSSKNLNKLMISLQRDIIGYNNILIEPKEICINLKNNYDDNNILLSVALLIYLNKISNEVTI